MSATLVDVKIVLQILKVLGKYNYAGAIKAFEGQDPQVQVEESLVTADAILQILGLFVPGAAMADEYVRLAVIAEPILWPFIKTALSKLPPPAHATQPNEYEAWGHVFTRWNTWSK